MLLWVEPQSVSPRCSTLPASALSSWVGRSRLRLGDAQALEFEDATFDTVVCTRSLCAIPDDRAAVAEVRRVLRPGGRFVLLEHVRSPVRAVRGVQRLLAPTFVRFGADHVLREPLEHVQAEGFSIEVLERSKLGLVERLLARKPGPGGGRNQVRRG
jgi:ubiquinone/menaquinone biosynthesis C-methylase UbiE